LRGKADDDFHFISLLSSVLKRRFGGGVPLIRDIPHGQEADGVEKDSAHG
jgi:hypothetical protein